LLEGEELVPHAIDVPTATTEAIAAFTMRTSGGIGRG
jgi:hypothetical protein